MPKLRTGAVQKTGQGAPKSSGGTPAAYHGNSRLPLNPKLQGHFKSQGTKQKD
jgi:hypothetical protein